MIDAALEIQTKDLPYLVRVFCSLPGTLRPTHYRFGEDEKLRQILDIGQYCESIVDSELGPMLKGSEGEYVIDWSNDYVGGELGKKVICHCHLKVSPSLAEVFLVQMTRVQPIFGYACSEQERHHRNRLKVEQNNSTIESWVGRDLGKYVSGFYWLTLLSDVLVERHNIPLSEVKNIALEHKEFEGGLHLFRFYERPNDWASTDKVAKLCASLPGVFDVEIVRSQAMGAKNYLELDRTLDDWM